MGWSDDIKLASEIEPKLNELIAGKRIERVEWHDGHGDVLRLHLVDGNVVTIRTKFDLLTKRERDQYKLQIEISTEAERRAERSERWKSHKPKLGDEWEVRLPGKRRIVKRIGLIWPRTPRSGHNRKLYVDWLRLPKGRYTGIWLADLLKYGKRLSTRAERRAAQDKRWKELNP
jgi:hypothetical protein